MSPLLRSLRSLRPPMLPTVIRAVQGLAFVHFFSTSICEIQLCTGFSMLPTLSHEGDFVLVSPLPYWSWFQPADKKKRGPQRGDVVVAASMMDPQRTISKRVIGVEGDLIEVDPRRGDEALRKWVSEADVQRFEQHPSPVDEMVERFVDSEGRRLSQHKRRGENQWVRIPKGHVWLQGDNMSNSTDSRMYGPVPIAIVKGKVLARVSRVSTVGQAES
ncbi:hypothetical protein P7C73_g6365, partial [Tremellales sp. Uapishka_1]